MANCTRKYLLPYIDDNFVSRGEVCFCLDIATCHYKKESREFFGEEEIPHIDEEDNLPQIPQLWTIDHFLSVPKQKVHENNWKIHDEKKLTRRIQKCSKKIDTSVCINLFKDLKSKLHFASKKWSFVCGLSCGCC